MAKFTCAKCKSEVEKSMDEDPGCPCCGHGKDGIQEIAQPFQPYSIWIYPINPYWEAYETWCGENTWTSDGTDFSLYEYDITGDTVN